MTMPSQYILSFMEFLVNYLAYFFNSEIHKKFTINVKCPHVPQVNLSLYKKAVHYMSIKNFKSLPNWIADLVQTRKKF